MGTDSEWKSFEAIAAEARTRPARVEKLAYRAPGTISVPAQPGAGEHASEPAAGEGGGQADIIAGLEERLRASESGRAAESQRLRREARETAEQLGHRAEQQVRAAAERDAEQIRAALEGFNREREDYFAKVEREVVKLALAIAAQILHREVLLDPMLLAGAVRVALGQLGESTEVRLKCPPDQVERWRESLADLSGRKPAPRIEADSALAAGELVVETRVGSVELGLGAQLAEIGRGFFDLLEHRSGAPLTGAPLTGAPLAGTPLTGTPTPETVSPGRTPGTGA